MDKWIGERLEVMRAEHHRTQKELAAVVQHSQSWMSEVLKGDTDPGFHEVEAMVLSMGHTLEEVIRNPGKLTKVAIIFNPEGLPGPGVDRPSGEQRAS